MDTHTLLPKHSQQIPKVPYGSEGLFKSLKNRSCVNFSVGRRSKNNCFPIIKIGRRQLDLLLTSGTYSINHVGHMASERLRVCPSISVPKLFVSHFFLHLITIKFISLPPTHQGSTRPRAGWRSGLRSKPGHGHDSLPCARGRLDNQREILTDRTGRDCQ
jgi:hypothetical protein